MERPLPIQPEELLSHAHWMRSLARSLVSDAASADDVVQDSMVVALRRPPDSGRPVHAWLGRVVRNVASNLRRGEQRLADRHARRGAGEEALDPAATIERLDTQRLIVDLVRELDEPGRSTIVQFYFEGLTSPEIGRRMGVSDATVRWRIQKSLDQLRTRLERKFGSRDAWCAMLLPFAHSFPVAATATSIGSVTAGALTVGTLSKLAAVVVAVSLVGAGWWFFHEREAGSDRAAMAALPSSSEVDRGFDAIAPTVAQREGREPEAVPTVPAQGRNSALIPQATEAANAHVRARFVDATGKPWEGVQFGPPEGNGLFRVGENSTSGIDGRAELAFAIPENYHNANLEFIATREGCATRRMHVTLVIGSVIDLGDVVLEREARVQGSVRDTQGSGLGEVIVGLSPVELHVRAPGQLRRQGSGAFDRVIVTRSDSRGKFELRGVPAGTWLLWGHRDDLAYGVSEPFEVVAEEVRAGIDFEVPALLATDTIRGRVVDPEGKPAAQAMVCFNYASDAGSGMCSCLSGPDGRFEIILPVDEQGDLSAEDKQRGWTSAVMRRVTPGARDILLKLTALSPSQAAHLRVHGPENEPISSIKLMAFVRKEHGSSFGTQLATRELEAGLHEFKIPEDAFTLTVTAQGYVDGKTKELLPTDLPAELEIALEVAPILRGRVSAAGQPVSGAVVEALLKVRKWEGLVFNGFPAFMDSSKAVQITSSRDGNFELALQGNAEVYLRCVAPGFAATIVGPIDVKSATAPIEIELNIGGSIEGRVRAKDGTAVAGVIVGITCGDGYPRTLRSGFDGRFRFDGLSVGPWLVIERDEELTDTFVTHRLNKENPITWSCEVVAGRATSFDLVLDR